MTASKDMMSRPASSQNRLSVGSPANSLPVRQPYSRAHSQSMGSGSGQHRISRRKSSSFAPGNAAAIEAAVESGVANGSVAINRRMSVTKGEGSVHAPLPASLPYSSERPSSNDSVLADGPPLSSFPAVDKTKQKRRASDGTHLTKKEKAATGDLKCEQCGKAYKHGSCLNKHLWEHTPQWQYTSKLLISKHQQVQLLEAASVLMGMNQDGTATNDSDNSSSPTASGSSDPHEDLSSAETTPPPQSEHAYHENAKRYSNSSSAYSRSYQSASAFSVPPDVASSFGGHYRQLSASSNRPGTAGTSASIAESYPDSDPADLAAAMGLLNCRTGTTPTNGPSTLSGDIPPVPPLPAKYQSASIPRLASHFEYREEEDDVDMENEASSDEDHQHASRHHYDAEEEMFGKMD